MTEPQAEVPDGTKYSRPSQAKSAFVQTFVRSPDFHAFMARYQLLCFNVLFFFKFIVLEWTFA